MNKKLILISLIASCIVASILVVNKLYTFAIVVFALCAILLACLIKTISESKNPKNIYEKKLGEIIKTYEPILVDVPKIPNLEAKNIVIASSFEKMADIQFELKKPILYKLSLNSSSFFLLDIDVIYIYTLKVDETSFSPVDDIIASIEMQNKKRRKDKKILDDIDKTTIIKLDDFREFKVSPVRKRDVSLIEDVEITFEDESTPKEETIVEDVKQEVIAETLKEEVSQIEEVEETEKNLEVELSTIEETSIEPEVEEIATEEEIVEENIEEDKKEEREESKTVEENSENVEDIAEEQEEIKEEVKENIVQKNSKTHKKNHATERARKYRQQQKNKKN